MVRSPFCDYLNVSMPADSGDLVARELAPLFESVGASVRGVGLHEVGSGGTFKRFRRGRVEVFGASGQALDHLRERGCFSDYLSVIGSFPHRVTMLHAAADYAADGPAVFASLRRRALAGEVSLTHKRVLPENVRLFSGLNAAGVLTGTVYLGNRANADVWAKVYDKRQERLSRGCADIGPLVRVEVAVQSDVGATLRDAADPVPLFFQFASPCLVERAQGVSRWVAHAQGFSMPAKRVVSVSERITGLLDGSPDIDNICKLAREGLGSSAERDLLHMVAARWKSVV